MNPGDTPNPNEGRILFFLPHLMQHFAEITEVFGRVEKEDLSDAEWMIILNNRQSGKLLNHYYLNEAWSAMDSYLKQKTKLFCFLDRKQKGLTETACTFWAFFSPAEAAEYFRDQPDRPKAFSAQAIRPVPFPRLEKAFLDDFAKLMSKPEISAWQKLEKTADILKLSEEYLQQKALQEVDDAVKRQTIRLLNPEIASLQEEIFGHGAGSTIMARRLKSVLRIGWRYFRAKNELETKYFKKLLSDQAEERIKGLKLVKKKLIDFELEMAD